MKPLKTPTLVAEGVTKQFGATLALRGIDLAVHSGEWHGLIGPNGAGKTTLMKILAGLLPADAGRLNLMGSTIDPLLTRRVPEQLGFIPQEIALYPELTATENLLAFARFHGLNRKQARSRIKWALEWSGMAERQNERVATFSGGMKRRLNIACGVLHEPALLLLDEPTVGVDPQARQRIWTMLAGLRESGVALVHSSHQLDEVESTCDRVTIIDHGKRIIEGSISQLLGNHGQTPRRLFARFSASPPANAFGADLAVEGATVAGILADPSRGLSQVLATVESLGLELVEVRVDAPRLEDLFADLTGKALRE